MLRQVLLATAATGMLAAVGMSSASAGPTASGSVYFVTSGVASNAIPSNVPAGPAAVTFTIPSNPLAMTSGGGYTVGAFIASGGGSIVTGGGSAGASLNNTLWNFTGTVSVTSGEKFSAGHDDGLTLIIGGVTVISAPGGTSFVLTTSTYTGPAGNEPYQLVYGECCGPPAELQVNLPLTATPEPETLAIFGTGLAGLGLLTRRKRR